MKRCIQTVLILLCAYLASACQQAETSLEPSLQASQHQGSFAIDTGEVVEVCSSLSKGQKLSLNIEASAQVAFNLHFHVDKEVTYPIEGISIDKLSQELLVEQSQVHCLMWTGLKDKTKIEYHYSITSS